MTFFWWQFHRIYLSHRSPSLVWKLLIISHPTVIWNSGVATTPFFHNNARGTSWFTWKQRRLWSVLEIPTGPPVRGRQLWRGTGNFLLIFLQFYVYNLWFKAWGPTTFLTEFPTLPVIRSTVHNLLLQWMENLLLPQPLVEPKHDFAEFDYFHQFQQKKYVLWLILFKNTCVSYNAVDQPKFMGRPPDHPWWTTGSPESFLGCPNYFDLTLKDIVLVINTKFACFLFNHVPTQQE